MSLSALQNIGLTENEAQIYELLIKLGEIPVSILINESGLKRPTVYKILYSLETKGLISQRDIKKKIHVKPLSPTKLLDMAENKYQETQRIREDILSFVPQLNSLYIASTENPTVRTYEGIKGLKEIYEDILSEKKPIYAILQAAEVEPELYKWLTTTFVKKRVRAKIHVKAIVATSKASMKYKKKDVKEYRISVLVPEEKFPFEHEIDIYGDKIAFIHYKKGEPLIGVVINHPAIAQTSKAWFNLAWMGTGK